MRSPLLMEGPKTIAGEKGTVSERSFVMVSHMEGHPCATETEYPCRSSLMVSPDSSSAR